MIQTIQLRLLPSVAETPDAVNTAIKQKLGCRNEDISGYQIQKKSIDARGKQVFIQLALRVYVNEPFNPDVSAHIRYQNVRSSQKQVLIIGAGPAGLFAALSLLEMGIKPIILERGKDVRARRRDLAAMNKEGVVNPDSNYCFGEGGAGTYSDGKLYTRSNKRGEIHRILDTFIHFGAEEKIRYESHPHIGTNKLPQIITRMREMVLECGGEVHFNARVVDFIEMDGKVKSIKTYDGSVFEGDACILATGHSARDIFQLFVQKKWTIEAKPFALGVRIEHPQTLIDQIQYHCATRDALLPPAAYSLVHQVNKRGVFSFCMCPGGIIAPASTAEGELVVNGWSPSKRNNPFANSGMVVQIESDEVMPYLKKNNQTIHEELHFLQFQQLVEQSAFKAGGGKLVAPAQRVADFCANQSSATLPENSYLPGLQPCSLKEVLPDFVHQRLVSGIQAFGKKMKGYLTNEAILVATESRTSSPVKIPRDLTSLHHPQINNLYPCGEGAGYAGGIVSAAMDGDRVAKQIALTFTG
jgi:uncharacterized FAD-dependent dehydrogenase